MDLLNKILAHILGYKYYANIINTRGTSKCEISCFIFHTKEEAMKHKLTLDTTRSFMFIETVSFRSRKKY
jgi:hypothetical protein